MHQYQASKAFYLTNAIHGTLSLDNNDLTSFFLEDPKIEPFYLEARQVEAKMLLLLVASA